jgi:hypothetical protein
MSKEVYKLIALDMDGVVNSSQLIYTWIDSKCKELSHIEDPIQRRRQAKEEYFKEFANGYEAIFPELAAKISRICYETGADIVWSSTWRNGRMYRKIADAQEMFTRRGLLGTRLVGYTPDLGPQFFRCQEIAAFLEHHYPDLLSCRCAVLDDWDEAGYVLPGNCRFFQTDDRYGLTFSIARKIIKYFNSAA